MADGFAHELAFHTPFVLQEEFLAAFVVEENSIIAGLKTVCLDDLVRKEIDIIGEEDGDSLGSVTVDVRGYDALVKNFR